MKRVNQNLMEKSIQDKRYHQWQVNFIHGYLGSISNAARNRICRDEKHLFIKGLTTDDWKYFIEKRRTSLNANWIMAREKIKNDGIQWTKIKLKT